MGESGTTDHDFGVTHILAFIGFGVGTLVGADWIWSNAEMLVGDSGVMLRSGLTAVGGVFVGWITLSAVAYAGGVFAHFFVRSS